MASIISATTTNGLSTSADNSGSLQLATNNGTTAVTIDTSQRVGVGTTSPTNILELKSATPIQIFNQTTGNSNQGIQFQANGTTYGRMFFNAVTGQCDTRAGLNNGDGYYLTYSTDGSERMRITSGGNLEMASSAGILQTATNQTIRMPSSGGIGYIGNINSSSTFQIAYNSTGSGVSLGSGATSWGTFSDSRLKNITGTYTNALNDIAQIQPVKFTWKSDEDNKPQVGVIAQSVQNVVPESVDSTTIEMDGTEEYLTVRYTELIPLMIASIQELKAELDATKAEVAALKGVA